MTPEAARATLRPAEWNLESETPGPTDGRPPFSFKTFDAGEFVDLGYRGRLQLVFYNGILSATDFTPSDPGGYFEAVKRTPGASLLPNRIISLGGNTRVWRRGGSSEGPMVEWYDDCLRADQDSWIRQYS
jgi:hypothetical protein